MVVGLLRVGLAIEGSNSLKDKRKVVSSLVARLRNGFRVSASEVADHDLWRSACIGVAVVGNSATEIEALLQAIEGEIASDPRIEIRELWREIEGR
jgi:uncharacterized protein YlxP (DUF503 family)